MAIPILSLVVWLPFLGFVATILAGTTLRPAPAGGAPGGARGILSLVVWLPFLGFVATILAGTTLRRARSIALAVSIADTVLVAILTLTFLPHSLDASLPRSVTIAGGAQTFLYVEQFNWIPRLGVSYVMGLDGLSLPLRV